MILARFFHKKAENTANGETILDRIICQIREYGEALVAITQQPSELGNAIKANTSSKIIFSLGNGVDIADMETATRMTREEADCIDLADVGQAIVKVKGRIKQPIRPA